MKSQHSDKAGFTCINHPLAAAVTAKAWRIFREVEAFVLSDKCTCLEDVRQWSAALHGRKWAEMPTKAILNLYPGRETLLGLFSQAISKALCGEKEAKSRVRCFFFGTETKHYSLRVITFFIIC
jgi:hypothetical protein